MKNPRFLTVDDKHIEVGDPFILRFNGRYYLYPSTSDDVMGVRCFVSDDLINFTCYGLVAESPLLKYAYAPEVIYYNGEFIMCTSPRGCGHYFLKSNSPLGPFTFITDNLANMIDGSFILDKENRLHFLRADHNGISYLDFVDNKLINRKDILPQIGNAWTEGPSITYFNKYFYATYCGNDVLSSSYRIFAASSKKIDADYLTQSSPLLLSTKEGYSGLGHNSVVLGPSMDEYYVCYHKLDWLSNNRTTRYLCLDRLYFNKRDCACNYSNFDISDPKRADFEVRVDENNTLSVVNDKLLTTNSTNKFFTAEFNFKDSTKVVLGYIDEDNYYLFDMNKNTIIISKVISGIKQNILKRNLNFDFSYFHSLRVINDIKCEVLIDNVSLFYIEAISGGRIGYFYKDSGLYYTAYTNSTYTNSMRNLAFVIPGKIEANYTKLGNFTVKNNFDEVDSILVKNNDFVKYSVVGEKSKKYKLFARMKNNDCLVKVCSNSCFFETNIIKNDCEYEYSLRYLGEIFLDSSDEIKLEVLKGKIEFKYLIITDVLEEVALNKDDLRKSGELYLFSKYTNKMELKFRLSKKNKENLFGLIVNSTNYSAWRSNKKLSYMGYFVGFDNGLLVIDYCMYNRTRIYDKPYRITPGKNYKLRVEVVDNMIYVYVNDKLEIKTTFKYDQGHGLCGVYKCQHAKVLLIDYKDGDVYEN